MIAVVVSDLLQRVFEVENGARSLEKLSGSFNPAFFQKSGHWSCGCPQTLDEGRNVATLHVGQVISGLVFSRLTVCSVSWPHLPHGIESV